eukprot:SAG11_NODE_9451_length_910_cov_1.398274_1_plen_54_part_10
MPVPFEEPLRALALRSQCVAFLMMMGLQFGPAAVGLWIAIPKLWAAIAASDWSA